MIMVQVLPLAVFLGVFMTLGGFSRTSELTAMRASGISLWRIATPLLLASASAALFLLAASEYLVPVTARTMHRVFDVEVKGKPEMSGGHNIWLRENDSVIHVRLAAPEKNLLKGVTLFTAGPGFRLTSRIDAKDALYINNGWRLRQGVIRTFSAETGEMISLERFKEREWRFDKAPSAFAVADEKELELGIRDLSRLIRKLQSEGYDPTRYRVDLQARLATPFACLILAFLGIPFALRNDRNTGLAAGIAVSISIGIAYFILQAMLQAFGYSGALPPAMAAWAANLLFGMLGIWLLLWKRE